MTLLQEFGIASLLRNGGKYFCPPPTRDRYFFSVTVPLTACPGLRRCYEVRQHCSTDSYSLGA